MQLSDTAYRGAVGVGFQFTRGKIGDEEEKKKIRQGYGSAATGAESCRKAGFDAGGGGQAKEAGETQENYRRVDGGERGVKTGKKLLQLAKRDIPGIDIWLKGLQ